MVDLGDFFDFTNDMTAYVVDTHRPLHLNNLFENDQVSLFVLFA